MKFAVMGLGGRGNTYAHFIKYYGSELVAVCDPDITKKELAMSYGMPEDAFYTDEDEFFAKGKIADALVIATLDDMSCEGDRLGHDGLNSVDINSLHDFFDAVCHLVDVMTQQC